jgi:YgiT-type zinc finger domain-containing protein
MLEIKNCPVCGNNVKIVNQDWVGEFKGQNYVVTNLEYYICEQCGEKIYPRDAIRRIEASSPAYQLVKPG